MGNALWIRYGVLLRQVATEATATQNEMTVIPNKFLAYSFYIFNELMEGVWFCSRTTSVPTIIEGQNPIIVC